MGSVPPSIEAGGVFWITSWRVCKIRSVYERKQLLVADQVGRIIPLSLRAYVDLNEMKRWLKPQKGCVVGSEEPENVLG